MLDFRVAADKLAQFQSPDEIAGYLSEQGVKAIPEAGSECAIARYIKTVTGISEVFVGTGSIYINAPTAGCVVDLTEAEDTYEHTVAMKDFVTRYDMGAYPNLVEPSV